MRSAAASAVLTAFSGASALGGVAGVPGLGGVARGPRGGLAGGSATVHSSDAELGSALSSPLYATPTSAVRGVAGAVIGRVNSYWPPTETGAPTGAPSSVICRLP